MIRKYLPAGQVRDAAIRRTGWTPPKKADSRFAKYDRDPIGYIRDILGVKHIWPKFQEIADACMSHPYGCLVPSANATGKTFFLGRMLSWNYDVHVPSISLATATTHVQVVDGVFKELREARKGNPAGMLPKGTMVQDAHDHFIRGFTANNPDAFQGRHEKYMALLFDEATGIDRAFWERARTFVQPHPGHLWICTYNPNDTTSPAYEWEQSGRLPVVRLSALEHPNIAAQLRGEEPPIPGAIRLETVRERIANECDPVTGDPDPITDFEFPVGSGKWYRPRSPTFDPQMRGRWPRVGVESLWPVGALEAAFNSPLAAIPDMWPVAIGCDVARFGHNATAIVVRKGLAILHAERHYGVKSPFVVARLKQLCGHYATRTQPAEKIPCNIDDSGGYGSGVCDYGGAHNFIGVSAASASPDNRFRNMRCYLWHQPVLAAEKSGVDCTRLGVREKADLKAEWAAVKAWEREGIRYVDSKDDIKGRLGRSPDLADAANLSFYAG
jgi:hypothetical protein